MPDFDAITVALAARFAPGAVTPPAGYDNIRTSTGNLPGQMVPLPAVLVFPDSGVFDYVPSKRDSTHEFVIRFYYNQIGDLERDMVALRKWLTVLVDQLRLSTQLSGIVTFARIATWKIGVLEYANVNYSAIELRAVVKVNEGWAPSS